MYGKPNIIFHNSQKIHALFTKDKLYAVQGLTEIMWKILWNNGVYNILGI